jgi:type II secretion system protein I
VISKSNRIKSRSFSLLEVIITVAILSIAIVSIFRAFTTVLSTLKLSQNMTLACFLAEDKLWEIEQRQRDNVKPLEASGSETIQEREFKWDYTTEKDSSGLANLNKLVFIVSWQEKRRGEEQYIINTYLTPK